jgi:Transposase DDE domain
MKIICKTSLYVKVCDLIDKKKFSQKTLKKLLEVKKMKLKYSKKSLEEYLTLMILFKSKNYHNLKQFWYEEKHNNNDWPNMPSYPRFNIWIRRLKPFFELLIKKQLSKLNQKLAFIDSTKLETGKTYHKPKSIRQACKGYTSTGEFFGFKLHIVINDEKEIVNYALTNAKTNDLTPVKEGFLNKQKGKIFADSGYVSKEIYYKLMEKNIWFIAKPRQSMRQNNKDGFSYLPDWETNFQKDYKKRQNIENFFNILKNNLGMKVNKTKTFASMQVNVLASIFTYILLNKKLVNFTII